MAGDLRCNTLLPHELLRNGMADLNLRDGKNVPPGATCADPGLQGGGAEKPVHSALIRRSAMLSTLVNPPDGHRFDGGAESFAAGGAHL
jgi:hypothetical protein